MGIFAGFLVASTLAIFWSGIGYAVIIGIVSSIIIFILGFRQYDTIEYMVG
jgi:hypothetical protein